MGGGGDETARFPGECHSGEGRNGSIAPSGRGWTAPDNYLSSPPPERGDGMPPHIADAWPHSESETVFSSGAVSPKQPAAKGHVSEWMPMHYSRQEMITVASCGGHLKRESAVMARCFRCMYGMIVGRRGLVSTIYSSRRKGAKAKAGASSFLK